MDGTTLEFLKLFNERNSLSLSDLAAILNADAFNLTGPINYMLEQNYIKIDPNISAIEGDYLTLDKQLEITYYGRITLNTELKSIKKYKYIEFRAWITLAIAIAAFIKSFFLNS